ncbi:MAG TPA: ABC transporter permease [Roseiflexaceae bacterium]|nr:ABC transporter permease [Roseiflexaceae bacterium]
MILRRAATTLDLRGLRHFADLLRELVGRDLKLRYKRSLLGIAWALITPLVQLAVFTFLFRYVVRLDVPHYSSYVFSGVLAWNWFQNSLYMSAGAIVDNRELIRRPGFPAAVLPAVIITTNLIYYLLALPPLLALLWLDGVALTPAALALPLVMAIQFMLTLSLSYLVATCHVLFRDTQHLLSVALMLLFYLTPIFYQAEAVPEVYRPFYQLNPAVHLVDAYRAVLLRGELPPSGPTLALCGAAAVLLWVGYTVFMNTSHRFVEEL